MVGPRIVPRIVRPVLVVGRRPVLIVARVVAQTLYCHSSAHSCCHPTPSSVVSHPREQVPRRRIMRPVYYAPGPPLVCSPFCCFGARKPVPAAVASDAAPLAAADAAAADQGAPADGPLSFTIPEGYSAGMKITIEVEGKQLELDIPEGLKAGDEMQFEMP